MKEITNMKKDGNNCFFCKDADKIKNIDVFESTGRKVKTIKADGKEVNISDLKSGNYYLEITLKDGSTSFEQLIKE